MRVYIPRGSRAPSYVIAKTAVGFRSIDSGGIKQWAPLEGEGGERHSTGLYVLLRAPRCNLAELFEKCGKP